MPTSTAADCNPIDREPADHGVDHFVIGGTFGTATSASLYSVSFNLGATGSVTGVNFAGSSITVSLTTPPTAVGALNAIVTEGGVGVDAGVSSSTQVATCDSSRHSQHRGSAGV